MNVMGLSYIPTQNAATLKETKIKEIIMYENVQLNLILVLLFKSLRVLQLKGLSPGLAYTCRSTFLHA